MIIHESRKALYALLFLFFCAAPGFAQQLQPAPTFRLINSGYGASALGLGGAFVAVANDLSTIYWNPAGLGQLPGMQFYGDYRITGDSDEDFSDEVFPERFESQQRFSLTGDQLQALAVSYSFQGKSFALVPAFAWQRLGSTGPERELKEIAGVVEFPTRTTFFQSEGTFVEETKNDEEEYTFALAARASQKIMIGGSWSFLRNGPEQNLRGTFHDSFLSQPLHSRTDIDLQQSFREERSGNYFKVGFLFYAHPQINIGATVRFPYTVESDLFLDRTGPFTLEETFRDSNGQPTSIVTTTGTLDLSVTGQSEIEIPMEVSGGIAIRPSNSLLVSGSATYSDWENVTRTVSASSDPLILREETLPYPALRPTAIQQNLIQWRAGMEYLLGHFGRGLVIRSGIFRDGQPYANADGERVYFDGYTFGAGLGLGSVRFDVAFVTEKGELRLTPNSRTDSRFTHRRWVFSVGYISL